MGWEESLLLGVGKWDGFFPCGGFGNWLLDCWIRVKDLGDEEVRRKR